MATKTLAQINAQAKRLQNATKAKSAAKGRAAVYSPAQKARLNTIELAKRNVAASVDQKRAGKSKTWAGINRQESLLRAKAEKQLEANIRWLYPGKKYQAALIKGNQRLQTISKAATSARLALGNTNSARVSSRAAGGDRYAKAWATRIAKYGSAGSRWYSKSNFFSKK